MDKHAAVAPAHRHAGDPYRPFFAALGDEPSAADHPRDRIGRLMHGHVVDDHLDARRTATAEGGSDLLTAPPLVWVGADMDGLGLALR